MSGDNLTAFILIEKRLFWTGRVMRRDLIETMRLSESTAARIFRAYRAACPGIWKKRLKTLTLSHDDVEYLLTSRHVEVRIEMARSTDLFVPTPEQIERGLTDESWRVRFAWARRLDYLPTPEQIERGLVDKDPYVREVWQQRVEFEREKARLEALRQERGSNCSLNT